MENGKWQIKLRCFKKKPRRDRETRYLLVAFGYLAHEEQFVAILVKEVEIVDVPTTLIILFLSVVLDNNHEMTIDTAV